MDSFEGKIYEIPGEPLSGEVAAEFFVLDAMRAHPNEFADFLGRLSQQGFIEANLEQ